MKRRYRRRNPHFSVNSRVLWIGGIAAASVAAGYAVWKMTGSAAGTVSSGSQSVTLAPGRVPVAVAQGQTLTINLPAGASWNAADTIYGTLRRSDLTNIRVPTSGNAPATLTVATAGAAELTLIYTDSSGSQTNSSIAIN